MPVRNDTTRGREYEGLPSGPRGVSERVEEALQSLRYKSVRSTTLERIRVSREADAHVSRMPQTRQIGEGLAYLLDRISVPVSPHDLVLGRITEEVPDAEGEAFLAQAMASWNGGTRPPWMLDGGHECFAWDRLLRLGLPGLEEFAETELRRRTVAGDDEARLGFLRGGIRIYQAHRTYARRYSVAAYDCALAGPAENCAAIAEGPPQTFAQALQLIWLVGHVYCTMAAINPTLTFGRLDELLLGFYRRDLADGRTSPQEAGDLIEDFYCKQNLILGRGEHQMSGGSEKDTGWARNLAYDSPLYVVLGGRRGDGSASDNELSSLFLERVVPRFENPVVVLRYTRDLSDSLWRVACDKMRANSSMMVYNDENVIPAMEASGVEAEDAVNYTMYGCNWPTIPGLERRLKYLPIELPRYLAEELSSAAQYESIDEVYDGISARLRAGLQDAFGALRRSRREWGLRVPGDLRVDDCFLDGPIRRACSWQRGGVKYGSLTASVWSIATAADSMAALEELVFRSKAVSIGVLLQALRNDFSGQEALRELCLKAPKFGQDDDRADRHAVRLVETVLHELQSASGHDSEDAVVAFCCLETDMAHVRFGESLGATPDGRRAGEPTSENTSPVTGSARNGLTAMLKSVAKLPLNRVSSGALNVRVQPGLFAGDDGLARLTELLRAYFDMGGLQVQLSFVDLEELRDAQVNPDHHRDLMVRITGYSAAFVDMAKHAQEEIIRREEMAS